MNRRLRAEFIAGATAGLRAGLSQARQERQLVLLSLR